MLLFFPNYFSFYPAADPYSIFFLSRSFCTLSILPGPHLFFLLLLLVLQHLFLFSYCSSCICSSSSYWSSCICSSHIASCICSSSNNTCFCSSSHCSWICSSFQCTSCICCSSYCTSIICSLSHRSSCIASSTMGIDIEVCECVKFACHRLFWLFHETIVTQSSRHGFCPITDERYEECGCVPKLYFNVINCHVT